MDYAALAQAVTVNTTSRDRNTQWNRSSRDFVELLPGLPLGTLDPAGLEALVGEIQRLTNRSPRPGQILAIYLLLYSDQDVLFQAATGYGKSMIWQCAPLIGDGICLMISPLNLLTEQQTSNLPIGCTPLGLTSGNNTTEEYKKIAAGEYSHGKSDSNTRGHDASVHRCLTFLLLT